MCAWSPFTDHALQRCQERLGFRPSWNDARRALADIEEGRSFLVSTRADGRQVHIVPVRGVLAWVAFEPSAHVVLTVLPPGRQVMEIPSRLRRRDRFHREQRHKRAAALSI